jgi:PIN domain nuclease of toxin-antitoxin system
VLAHGHDWELVRGLLLSYELVLVHVVAADVDAAARLWEPGIELSLADRLCLATGQRLGATVWTADAAWGSSDQVRQIR